MKKILLLDDNEDILAIVEEVLNYERFDVKGLTLSTYFVSIAEKYRPDLMIIDYMLADGNGGELCRSVKAQPRLGQIPVILFSAYVPTEHDLYKYGCDAVISKPFDLEDLIAIVKELTGGEKTDLLKTI